MEQEPLIMTSSIKERLIRDHLVDDKWHFVAIFLSIKKPLENQVVVNC